MLGVDQADEAWAGTVLDDAWRRVEEGDTSLQEALYRELKEELGAEASAVSQVFLYSSPAVGGVSVQHFFATRLISVDDTLRSGPEFADPSRGGYDLDRVDLSGDALADVDLKPTELKEFILANRDALLAEVAQAR